MVDEQDESEVVDVGSVTDLMAPESAGALDRAAIDIQVATAKQFPRSVAASLKEAKELVTLDKETASTMYYVLPRAGRKIRGPSARLAEALAYSWGNLRIDGDIVSVDKTHVTAMGTCFDLERNVAIRIRVKRRITKKNGTRFDEDMIGVTQNAAVSIAVRNAILKVIPSPYVTKLYEQAQKASLGEGTMDAKRTAALDWFGQAGILPEQVYNMLGIEGLEDLGVDEIIDLKGIANAVKGGDTTLEMVFNPPKHSEKTSDLNQALAPDPETSEELTEAYKKALRKATDLSKAGALEDSEIPKLDELLAAEDFEGLLAMDRDFTDRLAEGG